MMRDFLAAASGIVALVLTIIGCAFAGLGLTLALLNSPGRTGFVFLGCGIAALIIGIALGAARMKVVQRKRDVISRGERCSGTIQSIEINRKVRVNREHPRIVTYRYNIDGRDFVGSDSVFDFPVNLKPGSVVEIIVLPESPASSALDPRALMSGSTGRPTAI
jgi:hypothetical protein